MRMTLLTSAALLGLALGPAIAQNSTSSTMSPPAPNAGVGTPEPTNSLPAGAGTSGPRTLPGTNLGTSGARPMAPMPMSPSTAAMPMTPGSTDPGMTGMRPMRGQTRSQAHGAGGQMPHGARMQHGRGMTPASANSGTDTGIDAPRGGEYRGGAGSPLSNTASNTGAGNTRSEIAPRLPDPGSASNTPQAYLAAAQRALSSGRTGAAQEALERAETRLLSRSTEPSMASSPDSAPMVTQIGNARRALAARDTAGARAAINAAMAGGG